MPPTYSGGVWIVTAMIGSSMRSISPSEGNLAGLSSSMTVAVVQHAAEAHRRRGGDEVEVVLALEALLDDLHVQEAEEAAAEPEAQRGRGLGLARERGVVEAQLVERVAQVRVARPSRSGRCPANTIGLTGLKPGSGSAHGRPASVIVSPTRASATSLMAAVKNPTSPGPSSETSRANGANAPMVWIS